MEIETLFTSSKWDILSYLAKGKYSPLELSHKLKTTIANISQQLRLLEFAGIVKKEKVSQREAGKPRTLYFLADDFSHMILVMKNCAEKRLIPLTDHHKIIMRIWMIQDVSTHYFLEKFFWRIEHLMDQLKLILVDTKSTDLTIFIVSDQKDIEKKLQDTQIKNMRGETKTIVVKSLLEKDIGTAKLTREKLAELHVIHDPEGIMVTKK
jgi:predicted transcriptional regulator